MRTQQGITAEHCPGTSPESHAAQGFHTAHSGGETTGGEQVGRTAHTGRSEHTAAQTRKRAAALLLSLLMALSLSGCGIFWNRPVEEIAFETNWFEKIPGAEQIESFFLSFNAFLERFLGPDIAFGGPTGSDGRTNGGSFTKGDGTSGDFSGSVPSGDFAEGEIPLIDDGLRPQGSAGLLRNDVVLISIYVVDSSHAWTAEEISYTCEALDIACDWLESKADEHGFELSITRNQPNLTFRHSSDELLPEAQKDYSFKYPDYVGDYLYHFDLSAIKEEFGTDSVGFVIFLPGEGTSFAYPYTATGYNQWDKVSYYEFANLFLYDESSPARSGYEYENPATYAHEILHLFGACDLYEENEGDNISQELSDYVISEYPDEIMYYTYEDDDTSNFEEITKDMSPFTLYFIGWGDGGGEMERFPEIERDYPAAFE